MRTLILFALVFLAAAPAASARELTTAERTQVATVASQAWPASRCHGDVQVVWQHTVELAANDAGAHALIHEGYEIEGYAIGMLDGTCRVEVRSDLAPEDACTTGVHEAGHLAGMEHGSSRVMGIASTGEVADGYVWPACRALAQLDRADAFDAVWAKVSEQTKVECARTSRQSFACRSSLGLVRKFWTVSLRGEDAVAKLSGAIA